MRTLVVSCFFDAYGAEISENAVTQAPVELQPGIRRILIKRFGISKDVVDSRMGHLPPALEDLAQNGKEEKISQAIAELLGTLDETRTAELREWLEGHLADFVSSINLGSYYAFVFRLKWGLQWILDEDNIADEAGPFLAEFEEQWPQ